MSTATNSPKGKNSTSAVTTTGNTNNTTSAGNGANAADNSSNIKYKRKYKDLKKRIRDIEDDNDVLNIKLSRARKNIHRLRVERSFLFDRLDHTEQTGHPSPSSSSTSDSDTDNDRNGGGSRSHRHPLARHKHHRHPYSTPSHHSRQTSSHSLAPPSSSHTTSRNAARSKTPPSRGSSVAGSIQHSASSSLGGHLDPSLSVPLSPSGKKAVKKRRKDPLAPKRPSNAFFIFSQQHRQQAREEKKEGNQSELTKFLGQQWKSMDTTEKKIYSELAIQDRQRYLDEMSQYQHEHKLTQGSDDGTSTKKKPGKPGRPPKAKVTTTLGTATTNKATPGTNGHSTTVKSKMGIQAIVSELEGEDLTSPDEDDVRMDVSEDEHEDEDDEDDDELEHDNEQEQEQEQEQEEEDEEEEHGDSHDEIEEDHESETNGHRHAVNGVDHAHVNGGYGDDVDMVEVHRAHGLIVSA
ncbi:MAG: hypothetical protein J3R72DRAFT_155146 [Linnemannia gamsii]|nr:MAG: hypothetical protein J3R72DRAFT_155146 [Linnemannia gamsii]